MSKESRTKYIILGMLSAKPASGYEINKMIKASTNYFWAESAGQLYPTLAKCVDEGLTTCEELQDKERIKKVYTITTKGREILNEWLKISPQKAQVRSEFMLKIFFAGNIDDKYAIAHLTKFQKETLAELEVLEKIRNDLKLKVNYEKAHSKFWLLSVDSGIKAANAEISWCQEAIAILNTSSKDVALIMDKE